jgi:hypothetical protein
VAGALPAGKIGDHKVKDFYFYIPQKMQKITPRISWSPKLFRSYPRMSTTDGAVVDGFEDYLPTTTHVAFLPRPANQRKKQEPSRTTTTQQATYQDSSHCSSAPPRRKKIRHA